MFRALHMMLVGNPITRRYQRRLTRCLKALLGCPDAYADLYEIIRRVRPAAVLDIGSYVGDTLVRFLDETDALLCGFEPTPDSFRTLTARFAGTPRVRLYPVALADRKGKQALFCNRNPQTNSLLDNDSGNRLSFAELTAHVEQVEIEVTTLDRWAAQHLPDGPLVVKADVQGAEGLLLDGGLHTFRDRVMAFYAEAQIAPMYQHQVAFGDLHGRLAREFGFCLRNVYPCFHDGVGRAVQLDALWVKESLLPLPSP
jgi:FkbM family methyltransferase